MKRQQGEKQERSGIYVYRLGDAQDDGYVDFLDKQTGIRFKSFLEEDIEKMVESRKIKNHRKRKGYTKKLQNILEKKNSETIYFLLLDDDKLVGLVVLNDKEEMNFFSYYEASINGFKGVNRCMLTLKSIMEMTGADNGKVFLYNANVA